MCAYAYISTAYTSYKGVAWWKSGNSYHVTNPFTPLHSQLALCRNPTHGPVLVSRLL
jgi:hypothetical protein